MAEKKWYEEWFNSPYYHLLYANRSEDEARNFVTRLVEKLDLQPKCKVLDVACGKGRHSKNLAALGLDVTGIDLSTNSIEAARQCEHEYLHFAVWDMRYPFKEAYFDVVFNIFSSFGYFDDPADDQRVVHAFATDLKAGGLLVFDYLNGEWAVKQMKSREIINRGEMQFHIQKRVENGFIKKKIEFLANGEDYSYEEQLKLISRARIKEMLAEAGLEVLHTYGDYELHDFEPGSSPRIIVIAKKSA